MIGTYQAECLLAVTGLWPGRAPSDTQRRLADKLSDRLAGRVRRFLDAEELAPYQAPEVPDQKQLRKQLDEPVDGAKVAEWFAPEESELATHYALLMQKARERVKAAWPIFPDPSLGMHNFELAPDELLDVVLVFRTVDSIESVMDDLDAHVLLPDQVALIAEVYPDLYEKLRMDAFESLVPFVEIQGALTKKKDLSAPKEEQMRTLMQLPMDVAIQAQQSAAQPQAQKSPAKPARKAPDESGNLQTPGEHIAERRVST